MGGMIGSGGGGSGSSQGTSSSRIEIPEELKPLYGHSARDIYDIQKGNVAGTILGPYFEANPMEVAPANELQNWVSQNIQSMWDNPEQRAQSMQYMDLATQLSGKRATGEGIDTSPAVLKASEAFDKLMQPQIQNQMGLSGLGKSSSLGNAMAMGKTNYMLPMVQDELAREQASYTNQANMYAGMIPQLEGMGTSDAARRFQTLSGAAQQGGIMRGIEQEPLTAAYQDFLRRQALNEQAIYAPFGAMATASIGQHAQSQQTGNTSSQQSSGFK